MCGRVIGDRLFGSLNISLDEWTRTRTPEPPDPSLSYLLPPKLNMSPMGGNGRGGGGFVKRKDARIDRVRVG